MILLHIKKSVKDPKVPVGNKFLSLLLLNSLMRSKNKQFLGYVDGYVLDRLKAFAKNHQKFKGLNEYCDGDISKDPEAAKFYHLLA